MNWKTASSTPFLSAIAIFAFSIVLSLWPTMGRISLAAKYFASSLLALIFTAAMIYFIGVTLQVLSGSTQEQRTVISLGFAHVFFGQYVDDAEPEWLFSLSTPNIERAQEAGPANRQPAATIDDVEAAKINQAEAELREPEESGGRSTGNREDASPTSSEVAVEDEVGAGNVSEGFGAPLWLLLLSVVGASLFTIKTVIENLEKSMEFTMTDVGSRVCGVIRHQFYILFAPLTAVIVYQLLVAAGSASEPITVGLAALASGIALSSVLERAWRAVEAVVTSDRSPSALPGAERSRGTPAAQT